MESTVVRTEDSCISSRRVLASGSNTGMEIMLTIKDAIYSRHGQNHIQKAHRGVCDGAEIARVRDLGFGHPALLRRALLRGWQDVERRSRFECSCQRIDEDIAQITRNRARKGRCIMAEWMEKRPGRVCVRGRRKRGLDTGGEDVVRFDALFQYRLDLRGIEHLFLLPFH